MSKLLIVSPEFKCSNEILTVVAMLSGMFAQIFISNTRLNYQLVPNVWLRPNNQRKEADVAKTALTVPSGDHLTLLNVYNSYQNSKLRASLSRALYSSEIRSPR
jgi:pre-mRNA-splicing factor ATP-dependent RNA helicase DHX15/PRP43